MTINKIVTRATLLVWHALVLMIMIAFNVIIQNIIIN